MRTTSPPLLPIFRSQLQGEVLAQTLLFPDREQSITELARRIDASLATVQREVRRLERAGILQSRRFGRTQLVSANKTSPLHRPLADLVLLTFGPPEIIGREIGAVDGVVEAFIHGSWAARYRGEPGRPPKDIDVLVIGSPNRDTLFETVLRAERKLGIPVNTTIRSVDQWRDGKEGFIVQVRSSPLVPIPIQDRWRNGSQ